MFGQIIIGLAGSGKSTYCKIVGDYLKNQGRKVKMVNLDPGASYLPYHCEIDIRNLVCINEIMSQEYLGPNGSIVFAMEYLLKNIQWLEIELSKLSNDMYLLIDFPGQVELYNHHDMMQKILSHFTNPKGLNYRFTTVFLAESFYCQTPESYIKILFATLTSMLQIGLPQVNILSKSSLLSKKKLPFPVECFTEVRHLEYLVDYIKNKKSVKYQKFYKQLVDIIVDLPWLSFNLLDCEDEESIKTVVSQIDMSNGFVVSQKFHTLIDEKHREAERELDKASDELVEKFF